MQVCTVSQKSELYWLRIKNCNNILATTKLSQKTTKVLKSGAAFLYLLQKNTMQIDLNVENLQQLIHTVGFVSVDTTPLKGH